MGAAAHARTALAADGTLMLVEHFAVDDFGANLATPGAGLHYAASTFLCTSNALSQPVGLALGAQPSEARLREVLVEAGYRSVRRAAETTCSSKPGRDPASRRPGAATSRPAPAYVYGAPLDNLRRGPT